MWTKRRKSTSRSLVIIVAAAMMAIAASAALYSSYAVQVTSSSASTSSSATTSSSSTQSSTSSVQSSTSSTGSNSTAAVVVLIPYGIYANQQLNFEPADIRLVIGVNNTVRWVNKDYVLHTISALSSPDNSSPFHSAPVFQGGSFEYTFTVPGRYVYYCPWHPGWMRGTVTVVRQNGR